MKIVMELDVTNNPDEEGVQLSNVSHALLDHAIEATNSLGLDPAHLKVYGISVYVLRGSR